MRMKGKKLISSIILVIIALCLFGQGASYATKDEEFYVALSEYRTKSNPNSAYGIGDPSDGGTPGKHVWDLLSYADATSTVSTNRNLYCVKGGYGDSWNLPTSDTTTRVAYKLGYDLKDEKQLISGLPESKSVYKEIIGDNYKQILWLTDNMYISRGEHKSSDEFKNNLLRAAGITSEDFNIDTLTDDDIDVVQQIALWYFTNTDEHKVGNLDSIHISNTNTENRYMNLDSYLSGTEEGRDRLEVMNALYTYLISSANANKDKYNTENKLGAPITIANDNLQITSSTIDSTMNKVGPIKLTKNNDLPYNIDITVKDGSNNPITTTNDSFVDSSENVIDINSDEEEIYILIPKTAGSIIKVNVKLTYEDATTTLWIPGTANNEQPIIEVEKNPYEVNVPLTTDEPSPFDLALRKYISAISSDATFEDGDYLTNNGKIDGTYTRAPQVDVTPLKNGQTTATYTHSKTPLKVQKGDYIEYTLRVYNEGNTAGYAEEITDYILSNQGLEFVEGHSTNTAYGWTKDGNKVKTNHLSSASSSNLINAFDTATGTTLDYKEVKIVFKVIEPNSSNNTLVNIAEVTDDKDNNGNDVEDRDSTPGTDNKNYPNDGYNTENHEDDIDYEPVILKEFDLALRKFITAVSSDATFEAGEYLTGDKSREPVVTYEGGKLVYTHPKDPVPLKSGDYVLYTLRVYNEGEIDGYASLIRDMIPEGLSYEAVLDHPINVDNLWKIDAADGSITTDAISKDKEIHDGDYLIKALKKNSSGEVTISKTDPLNPDYKDVQVVLKVTEPNSSSRVLDNRAQIADDTDENGDPVDDKDSKTDEWNDGEDDQDHDPVVLEIFDLALRKFITKVDDTVIDERIPQVDTTTLKTETTATYKHAKQPVEVKKGSTVVYTLRVYNEGTVDGYASKITDYLPEELEFIPTSQSTINAEFGWQISDDGRVATTNYLAEKLLEKRTENTGNETNPYTLKLETIQIECRVKDTATIDKKITNVAEISEYKDENKNVIATDIDSKSNSLTDGDDTTGKLPTDEELPDYKGKSTNKDDLTDKEYHYKGQEDDDDFEKIIIPRKVDLALTKFITAISEDATIENGEYLTPDKNVGSDTNPYDRQTAVNTNPLKEGQTDAIYTQVKTPLVISNNAYVLYNIRVYNEGEVDVYAGEVTDYLPEYLTFVDGEFNRNYGWTANGQTVKTTYLSHTNGTDKILKAFDGTTDDGAGSGLDYKDLPILCQVSSTAPSGRKMVNSAEITKYEDKDGNNLPKDVDSTPDNLDDDKKNKEGNPEGRYDEDDEDYEVVLIRKVDLALTKFIIAVSDDATIENGEYITADKNIGSATNPYLRQTAVNTKPLKEGGHDAIYTQVKDPLNVNRNSYVLYNIRVYNEGEVDVYAGEVTDYLPENLDFVDGEFNKLFGWSAEGQVVKTTILSHENGEDKILKAFDSATDDGAGSGLDYKDLPILCQVNSKTPTAKELVNTAEVTKYEDEDGKDLPKDIDSTPDNKENKNDKTREEDDDDYDVIIVEEFDLSLIKYVSQVVVTENGNTTTTETNNTGNKDTDIIPKVEVHRKRLDSTVVKFIYTIRVTNEGDIAGYAKELTDYIPEGLEFKPEDNSLWTDKGDGTITTRALENTLLQPGESADVKVTFTWINGANNLNLKRNVAEISEDYNDKNIPDRDSTPGNKVDGEDDIDFADVLLSIKTGKAQGYIFLGGAILIALAAGIAIIKKYVVE